MPDNQEYPIEKRYADEDVDGYGAPYQTVYVVNDNSNQDDINEIEQPKATEKIKIYSLHTICKLKNILLGGHTKCP